MACLSLPTPTPTLAMRAGPAAQALPAMRWVVLTHFRASGRASPSSSPLVYPRTSPGKLPAQGGVTLGGPFALPLDHGTL